VNGNAPLYNFRIAPEALWLIVNTVLGTLVVDLIGRFAGLDAFPTIDTLEGWFSGLAVGAVRTLLGALLAAATGGQFLGRGQKPTNATKG
jgi:hypothetical protein